MYSNEDLERFYLSTKQWLYLMVNPFSYFVYTIMCLTISFQNGTKIVQTESRTSSSLECYAEVQPILYKDTRRKVVAVQVDDRPSENCAEKSVQSVRDGNIDTKRFEKIPLSEDKVHCPTVRIWLEQRMSNGLYLSRKNLSYQELSSMIEKLEGLC